MKKNVGKTDKVVRLSVVGIIAILFLTQTVSFGSLLGIVLAVVAAIFAFTSFASWCAIYAAVGASTCAVEPSNS